MTFTLQIPGQPAVEPSSSPIQDSLLTIKTQTTIKLSASRGEATSVSVENVNPRDAVCLHYADGLELWMSAGELADRSNTGGARGAPGKTDSYEVSPALFSHGTARGAGGVVVTVLEVFGVDLKGKAAYDVAEWFENKQLANGIGVFPVDLSQPLNTFGALSAPTGAAAAGNPGGDAGASEVVEADHAGDAAPTGMTTIPAGDKPLLVFLHGTASSFSGSYGKLWDVKNAKGAELRNTLAAKYAGRCYALEHRSLTVSPIDNALDLVKALPQGAVLHLVSHSRGGLIGELLCLAGQRGAALTDKVLGLIFKEDRTLADLMGFGKRDMTSVYAGQREQLTKLLDLLDAKNIRVTRFVRAACPAMGTTLASGKLDRWLSLLKFTGGVGIVADIRDFLLAVVHERTDPRTLPGLEAMMPGSALVRLLNLESLKVNADLSVIAGDCGDKSLWDSLKFALADWFFEGDNDLVVNTGSMYGGARRGKDQARKFFTRGSEVNHFHYFFNSDSVDKLSSGLLRDDGALGGFDPLQEDDRKAPARAAPRRFDGPHPVAFVLPGIMGSSLAEGGEEIWLNKEAIFQGKIMRLSIERDVTAVAPLEKYYGDFLEFLGRTHEVIPFAYDWRRSVTESADALHQALLGKLAEAEAGRQPLHIVAHSMGGLVARAMLARHPQTWNRLKNLEGFRLMMLGTPNYGAFQAVRLVVGQYRVANMLALVDIHHGRDELLTLFSRFPGAAELLPWKNTGNRDFAAPELWSGLKAAAEESWPVPDSAALAQARATWNLLNTAPIDGGCMVYVAGWASKTACDYRVLRRDDMIQGNIPQIEFSATRRGDGTVPWDLGRLEGVKTWYADAEHGSLLANSDIFPAYLELLQTGKTTRLPDTAPDKSRGLPQEPVYLPLPPELPDGSDGLDSLGGFGTGRLPRADGRRRLPGVALQVKCGDLAYAGNPVCVGHYLGDTMVSAEKRLDTALDQALSNRMHMGIYPGRLGSWEIFIQENKQSKPGGALVIGLGQVGELAPGSLETAIARVMSDYALQVMQWHDERFGDKNSVRSARVSFLLIGTGAGSIEVRSSVEAILRGVKRANEKLVDSKLDNRVLIDKIELLELYQDIAIQAARALEDVLVSPDLAAHFTWSPREILDSNGHRRIQCDEAPNWWQRLEITHDEKREELRFIALTNRARAEETLVAGDLRLAKDFIRQSIATTQSSREISRTLFEMLLPNRLKQLAPERHDLVLVVDENSASYPWELLEDRWTDGMAPPATVSGMVRQFKTGAFRAHPAHSVHDNAYVVGNPRQTRFGNLPGARDEAENVVRVLSAGGFGVRQEIESTADAIMIGLHGDTYRILHLAGHGVHEWPIKKPDPCDNCRQDIPGSQKFVSGMVIGDKTFLTPGDVAQMRWAPELVFINCCHLGNTESQKSAKKFNHLAANLAVEFIEMGVKAVVAAGWAVDDAAAKAFAGHFYQRMLADEPFGRAVQGARKAIFDAFPGVNTWGAYQCYGDPDFRLYNKASGTAKVTPPPFYTRAELVVELENLARAERTGNGDAKIIEEILGRIPLKLKENWLSNADVLAALGFAYSEFDDLGKAVECLDQAVTVEKSDMSLRWLEKRANFKARWAAELFKQGRDKETGTKIDELFVQAFAEIEMLLELGKTSERYNLCASTWKRKAMTATSDDDLRNFLQEMRNSYQLAESLFKTNEEKTHPNEADRNLFPYPTINKWVGEILLAKAELDEKTKELLLSECRAATNWAETQNENKPGFRLATVPPDSLLVQALALGNLAEKKAEILRSYQFAKERGTSKRAFASVLDQFDLLLTALPHCYAENQLAELRSIAQAVRLLAK